MEQNVIILISYKYQVTRIIAFISRIENSSQKTINRHSTLLVKLKKGIYHE